MPESWAGIDAGKTHHHCTVINAEGQRLVSRKIATDEVSLWTSSVMSSNWTTASPG
ncbi:transposase [Streptomyces sp. NBC_00075]|uniref:IS110 family transposase n=1 Tax=Streptomyces sp. NBC_00075 TaxID=2975641 RepID=UPI00386EEB0D